MSKVMFRKRTPASPGMGRVQLDHLPSIRRTRAPPSHASWFIDVGDEIVAIIHKHPYGLTWDIREPDPPHRDIGYSTTLIGAKEYAKKRWGGSCSVDK